MMGMDSKEAIQLLKVTRRQLNYMLKKVDGLVPVKYGESQGKARYFRPYDFTRLWLAFALKADGYAYSEIQKAIDILNDSWDGESPEEAGVLLALGDGKGFRWASDTNYTIDVGKGVQPASDYDSFPKIFYNVKKVANENNCWKDETKPYLFRPNSQKDRVYGAACGLVRDGLAPTATAIARITGMHYSSVHNCIKALAKDGYMQRGEKQGVSQLYYVPKE